MTGARYPLHLDLTGRRVLVVGAGAVAVRRVRALVDAGADVHVVASEVADDLPPVRVDRRAFVPRDVDGAWLVHACTGAVDAEVAAACTSRGVWCVRADDAGASPAWTPAVARVDDVVVSVSAGRDPRRTVALRDALATALETGDLPLRRHRPGPGRAAYVTATPDPDLLTVRARRLLATADVVLHDPGTVPPLPGGADVVAVEPGEAARCTVERVREGQVVVRLVAGREPADEIATCAASGVPVEVVP
ncbi:MAG: SAM-dependent methyltransferase [Actinomycetota bacterium]|nr:SAM-dependent methyltransferase [Actinomycetota bacterium]